MIYNICMHACMHVCTYRNILPLASPRSEIAVESSSALEHSALVYFLSTFQYSVELFPRTALSLFRAEVTSEEWLLLEEGVVALGVVW